MPRPAGAVADPGAIDVLLDGAHNVAGAEALARRWTTFGHTWRPGA